ncbi:MAG: ATP-binding protein [Polyangiaceae bacterium]|nr:ATP-binding protein [Polyangiaceae bacterium]
MDTLLERNAHTISSEIAWFRRVVDARFEQHGRGEAMAVSAFADAPPTIETRSPYGDLVLSLGLNMAERLVLLLAYLPHVQPNALDPFFIQNRSTGRRFTELGGFLGTAHGGFLPTLETAMFVLAGDNVGARLTYHSLFRSDHPFFTRHIFRISGRVGDEPFLSSPLGLTEEYVERLTTGQGFSPPYSAEFPAQRLTTALEWKDLVLDRATLREVEDIIRWTQFERKLLDEWNLRTRLRRGYRCLFYGPPGTGKTLTASLLGKVTDMPVYRIDLSKVVSKYIGETEKNLASLFDHAEDKHWILFFDEADSLFGKRTETKTANDRHANQQVSYLLQRIEDFPSTVILASNLKGQIDEAFARRFQSVILFKIPAFEERLALWRDCFQNKPYPLAPDVDLTSLARDHELSGGSILNVLRYACLRAVGREPEHIAMDDLLMGVRRELHKEGRL